MTTTDLCCANVPDAEPDTVIRFHVELRFDAGCESAIARVPKSTHYAYFQLVPGRHIAHSTVMHMGTVRAHQDRRLLGQLSFTYRFDENAKMVYICGCDFPSAEAMCLTTFPEGTEEFCHQRCAGGFIYDDLMSNPHWNYTSRLSGGFHDLLKSCVESAAKQTIKELRACPGLKVAVRELPPKVPDCIHHANTLVIHRGKVTGAYNPGMMRHPDDSIRVLESTFKGTMHLKVDDPFANILGTTDDPRVQRMSWIDLWSVKTNNSRANLTCTSNGFSADQEKPHKVDINWQCSGPVIGGHCVGGIVSEEATALHGKDAFIIPICTHHNNQNNFFMKTIIARDGVWIDDLMKSN